MLKKKHFITPESAARRRAADNHRLYPPRPTKQSRGPRTSFTFFACFEIKRDAIFFTRVSCPDRKRYSTGGKGEEDEREHEASIGKASREVKSPGGEG